MSRNRRRYSLEFKQEAVRLVAEQGVTQVARDLGVDRSVVRAWTDEAAAGERVEKPIVAGVRPDLEAEVRRLRRENAQLREEREILKKAAAFFAKERERRLPVVRGGEGQPHDPRGVPRAPHLPSRFDWAARPPRP